MIYILTIMCKSNYFIPSTSRDSELMDLYYFLTDFGIAPGCTAAIEKWLDSTDHVYLQSNSMVAIKHEEDVYIGSIFDEEWRDGDYSKCVIVSKVSFIALLKTWKEYLIHPPEVFTITLHDKELSIFPGRQER